MNTASSECLGYGHDQLSAIPRSVSEDIRCYLNRWGENPTARNDFLHCMSAFWTPGVLSVFLHRISHYLDVNHWRRSAVWVSRLNFLLHKVSITPQSCIGPSCFLPHPAGVTFHGRAGRGLRLYSLAVCCAWEDSLDGPLESGPCLGDSVTVGAHAVLLGPIVVGRDTKLAYGVRVDRDTPPGILGISPAVIGRRPST
ncbi:MAG: hypothetical protein ACRD88_22440 [Terriglobia bacterium]